MAFLQLAEAPGFEHLAQNFAANTDKYIFIPAGYRGAVKDSYVREDLFDDLSDMEFENMMQELAPYQNTGLSSKASRQDRRKERKQTKAANKKEKIQIRQAAKTERVKAGGGIAGAIGKVGDIAKSILAPGTGVDVTAGGKDISFNVSGDQEESFFSKYKTPLLIGGGLLVGGIIYTMTKKKK
jgi:preprotein translocase subunit YajC